jgi:hypothetical protein
MNFSEKGGFHDHADGFGMFKIVGVVIFSYIHTNKKAVIGLI